MIMPRVVISGMGIISPVGNNIADFGKSIENGVCGIDKITKFDTADYKVKLAAEVKGFDPSDYFESVTEARRADLYTQYAVAAATQAVNDSGISISNTDPYRLGVYIGSGIGGMSTFIAETTKLLNKGPSRVSPLFIPMMISNMASGTVAIKFGAKGPTLPTVTACATSSNAFGEAYRAIKHGYADAIITGGSEATINGLAVAGFTNCRALSESTDPMRASIPFDAERSGFVMGEGAAILVLESLDHALARNARIYAEVVGYGNTCDAYHMTSPDPEAGGAIMAIKLAVEESGITAGEHLYFNAHGTGTHMNDSSETKAIKNVFGEGAYKLHMSSTKSMTGHMLGATGAAELIVCTLTINSGIVPPTINYSVPDPECDINCTPGKAVKATITETLSTSLGFGGHNACIALRKYEE